MVFIPCADDQQEDDNNEEALFRSGKNEDLFHDA